jgi:hypothetical protein
MATNTFLEDTGDTCGHDDATLKSSNKVKNIKKCDRNKTWEKKHALVNREIEICQQKMFDYRYNIEKHINDEVETKHVE